MAVCESLLLALNDRDVMPERNIVGVLKEAAKALEATPQSEGQLASHAAAALLIHKIIDGQNSVRRP